MKWLIKQYMISSRIKSLRELADRTGIQYLRLLRRLDHPENFLMYEIRSLDDVLKFSDEDMLRIIKGGVED